MYTQLARNVFLTNSDQVSQAVSMDGKIKVLSVVFLFLGLALGACRHPDLIPVAKIGKGLTSIVEAEGFRYKGRNRQGFDCYVLEGPVEIEFILLPKSTVSMTTFDGEESALNLDPFLIASSELTCSEFATLTGRSLQDVLDQCEYERRDSGASAGVLPMRNVGFFESMRMAHNARLELPSFAQWKWAAFGPKGLESKWTETSKPHRVSEGQELGWCGGTGMFGNMAERCSDSGTLMGWEYPEGKGAQMKFVAIWGEGPSYCAVVGESSLNNRVSTSLATSSWENLAPKKHIGIRLALTLTPPGRSSQPSQSR